MAKSKKTKNTADNASPAQVEDQEANEESVPATIVEATDGEVFPSQADSQEVVVEQLTPVNPPRVSKRPYISLVESHLETGDMDKKVLLALIMEKYPTVNRNGASTFLTDALNPRYSHWKGRVVTKTPEGKLIFADKLESPEPEVQTTDEPTDSPAE